MNKAGWYSIIRFVPDLFRGEGVNLGVVLLVAGDRFLECRITVDYSRAHQFFGDLVCSARLPILMNGLKQALAAEKENVFTPGHEARRCLGHFIDKRQDMLQLTDLRSCVVDGPEEELSRLFSRLVVSECVPSVAESGGE